MVADVNAPVAGCFVMVNNVTAPVKLMLFAPWKMPFVMRHSQPERGQ